GSSEPTARERSRRDEHRNRANEHPAARDRQRGGEVERWRGGEVERWRERRRWTAPVPSMSSSWPWLPSRVRERKGAKSTKISLSRGATFSRARSSLVLMLGGRERERERDRERERMREKRE